MQKSHLLILTLGVFSILNTEMGVIGILPMVSAEYGVTIASAGLLVSMFALVIAFAGPIMPLLFSKFARKKIMILVLGIFMFCNIIAAFAINFPMLLISRMIPAFFHPVYVSLALTAAADSASQFTDIPKYVAKVMIGVSAGMVLGAPVAAFISSSFSLQIGMLFFALVNALALIATILFIPTLPSKKQLSYASQLKVLKKKELWIAMLGVVFLNGSIFGVYSYLASYLGEVSLFSVQIISILLFIYGLMNIVGNSIAGKMLSEHAKQFMGIFPIMLASVYILMLATSNISVLTAVLVLFWGILAGSSGSINQYWISSAAPEAQEFANGLFLTASNLGVTIATSLCGAFISTRGTSSVFFGGLIMLACATIFIIFKIKSKKEIIAGKIEFSEQV